MEEGLVTSYLNRLNADPNPGLLLTRYYLELHQLPSSALNGLISGISKLVRLYGRNIVFHSITTTTEIDNVNHENVYRLLLYLCKKSITEGTTQTVLLDETVKDIEKRIKKIKASDVRSPFDD